jgi:predicted transcriptional regulator
MANALVGPVVVSIAMKLLQREDTVILRAGGKSPRRPMLINKMMAKASYLIHNRNQAWPERCQWKISDIYKRKDVHKF